MRGTKKRIKVILQQIPEIIFLFLTERRMGERIMVRALRGGGRNMRKP